MHKLWIENRVVNKKILDVSGLMTATVLNKKNWWSWKQNTKVIEKYKIIWTKIKDLKTSNWRLYMFMIIVLWKLK